jgi:serine protease Do
MKHLITAIQTAARQTVLVLSPMLLAAGLAQPLAQPSAEPAPAAQPEYAAQPAPPAPPPPPAEAPNSTGVIKMMSMGGSFLGVGVREIDAERARALNLKDEYGVEITRVEDDSPAAKAGLKVGDAVLEFNGQRVEGTEQFVRVVKETPAGRTVKLLVHRGGASMTLPATIATRKMKTMTMPGMGPEIHMEMPRMEGFTMPDIPKAMMSWRSAVLGVEAESLGESQLASYFGVKEGVLVRSVMKGTAADKAGIRAGDVLLKVDDTKVATPRDVTSAVRTARTNAKKNFPVVLMREKKEVSLSVTVDEESGVTGEAPKKQKLTVRQQM